jgi:transcriptional regulator with XRE-family HTH domain
MVTMSIKSDLHEVFCSNVRMARAKAGLTQVQVAEKMGVTQGTYSAFESGKGSPTLDLVERIAKALGVKEPAKLLHRHRRSAAG